MCRNWQLYSQKLRCWCMKSQYKVVVFKCFSLTELAQRLVGKQKPNWHLQILMLIICQSPDNKQPVIRRSNNLSAFFSFHCICLHQFINWIRGNKLNFCLRTRCTHTNVFALIAVWKIYCMLESTENLIANIVKVHLCKTFYEHTESPKCLSKLNETIVS